MTVSTDVVRAGGRTASAVYGGVRLGSWPAVIGTGVIGLGLLALYAALASAYD